MKKILFLSGLLITTTLFSQVPKALRGIIPSQPLRQNDVITLLNCNPVSQSACNFISNSSFTPDAQYDPNVDFVNPFNYDYAGNSRIPSWNIGTGTPTVADGINFPSAAWPEYPNPPVGSPGYYFGAAGLAAYLGIYASESIVQKIPQLTAGRSYTLNFYKMYMNFTSRTGSNYPVDHFRIVLMHCSDYQQTFWTNVTFPHNYEVPPLPANSQIIYCESTVFNGSWERSFIKFTPNQNYDMIWIYPEEDHDNPAKETGIFVSFPELIDITGFNAGGSPNPTPPNCTVTIGPATPNCGPKDAVFTWLGPNGQSITVPLPLVSQQIQVDASVAANAGTWTLVMSLPGTVTTNNTCSQNITSVQATVNVPFCGACTPPTISANGPLDQCIQYESPFLTFTTNLTSNIQWYNNGNPIPYATNQSYTENNNPGPNWPTSTGTYYVKNTLTNCISQILSVTRRNYSTPNVYPGSTQTTLHYCKNNLGVLHQEYSITDPNTIYRWQILDPFGNDVTGTSVILGANNSTTYHTTISFLNYPYTTATIICGTTDNGCTNTATPYQVTIHPDPCNYLVRTGIENVSAANNGTNSSGAQLYPNPANSQVTIKAAEPILGIEISDLMSPFMKRVNSNAAKTVVVNVSDLKPGVYNCKIITARGAENQKMVIRR
ncbi:MAG TPA: T9SS type A sorting domain-containing protein [Ferruginibacter sp.]|nr:hypothetical protein [Chitinophagaceae bacterium]HRI23894.1 T9SS type A sorting domain-containing protein [Ferruginibacter sp.]